MIDLYHLDCNIGVQFAILTSERNEINYACIASLLSERVS